MMVAELIKLLQTQKPDAPVVMFNTNTKELSDINGVHVVQDMGVVAVEVK